MMLIKDAIKLENEEFLKKLETEAGYLLSDD